VLTEPVLLLAAVGSIVAGLSTLFSP